MAANLAAHVLDSHSRMAARPVPRARSAVRTPRNVAASAGFSRSPAAPPDAPKETKQGREWLQTILSRFGPVKEKSQNPATLEFEKPLLQLDQRIKEVSARPHCCRASRCIVALGAAF